MSVCRLQPPSLPSSTILCSNNSILFTRAQEGYSLSVEGVDLEGNTAGPVQFTWSTGMISNYVIIAKTWLMKHYYTVNNKLHRLVDYGQATPYS